MNRSRLLARGLALSFFLAGVGGLAFPLLIGRPDLSIFALYAAFPLILSAVLFVVGDGEVMEFPTIGAVRFRATVAAFLILQGLSFVLLASNSVRPYSYYAVVALLAGLVFYQILTLDSASRSPVVLGEIGAILLNVVWGATFKYHFFFGQTDLFPHTRYVEVVLARGRVTSALAEYQFHPLWHVYGAIEIELLGFPVAPRYVLFFTSGIAFLVAIGGVYVLTRDIFGFERFALTAALMTSLNSFVILYAMYSIPRSIVSVLSIVVLIAALRSGYRYLVLLVFVTVGIVVYHTVSTPFILVMLGVLYLLQFPLLDHRPIKLHTLLVIAGIQLGYWMLVATGTMRRVSGVLNVAQSSGSGGSSAVGGLEPMAELVNYLSFSVVILCVTFATLVVFSNWERERVGRVVVFGSLVLVGVSFPGPLQLLGVSELVNVLRFGQYTFSIIAIGAAAGLLYLAGLRVGRLDTAHPIFVGAAILLVISASFFAVSNDFVASDNPLQKRGSFYTNYFTESEDRGARTAAAISPGFVYGDQITCKYLNTGPGEDPCHIMEADLENSSLLANSTEDIFLVRETELERRSVRVYPSSTFDLRPTYSTQLRYVEQDDPLWDELVTYDRVYASEDVVGYSRVEGRGGNESAVQPQTTRFPPQ